jgi:iron complex transport system ATP-binding protein
MDSPYVQVKDIDCYYGRTRILQQINLRLGKGEFVGLIGPNGSGKTTLLRSIGRTLKPRGGSIYIAGQDIYRLSRRKIAQKVATVPQESPITFAFTVFEIVLMGRTPHLKRFQIENYRDLEIVRKAMKDAKVEHLSQRLVTELSGGEKQKVIIAQALAQQPELLLLDEPTTHLDIYHQIEILDLIKSLSQKGLAVIAVFHDLNLAAQYCDYLVLLSKGRIVVLGTPSEVLTHENIKRVFGVDVVVDTHHITGNLIVSPVSMRDCHARQKARGSQ